MKESQGFLMLGDTLPICETMCTVMKSNDATLFTNDQSQEAAAYMHHCQFPVAGFHYISIAFTPCPLLLTSAQAAFSYKFLCVLEHIKYY